MNDLFTTFLGTTAMILAAEMVGSITDSVIDKGGKKFVAPQNATPEQVAAAEEEFNKKQKTKKAVAKTVVKIAATTAIAYGGSYLLTNMDAPEALPDGAEDTPAVDVTVDGTEDTGVTVVNF